MLNKSNEKCVIIVTRNEFDLLTKDEKSTYSGMPQANSPEYFNRYILTIVAREHVKALLVVDGASQDSGPEEFELPNDYDFWQDDGTYAQQILDKEVRIHIEEDVAWNKEGD